jgi:hypothetical protein
MSLSEREAKAFEFKTLPKYVYKSDAKKKWVNFELVLINLPLTINPTEAYLETNDLDLSTDDLLVPWIFGNRAIQELIQNTRNNPVILQSATRISDDWVRQVIDLWSSISNPQYYQTVLQMLQSEKDAFFERFAQEQALVDILARLDIPDHTSFQTERIRNVFQVDWSIENIIQLFNRLDVSDVRPLIIINNYYKVFPNYPFTLDIPSENECVVTVLIDNIPETIIIEHVEQKTWQVTTHLEYNVIRDALPSTRSVKLAHKLFNGSFSVTDYQFAPIVFSDMVMNHPLMSKTFYIDERLRVFTNRALFLHYIFDPNEKPLTITLSQKNENVRIRFLNIRNEHIIPSVQDIMLRYLELQKRISKDIIAEYNAVLGTKLDPIQKNTIIKKHTTLHKQFPDVFPQSYARRCQFAPRIVDEKEADGIPTLSFAIDGKQVLFACDEYKERPYPRLLTKEPFLPCCFKQKDKRTLGTNTTRFLITDKFVGRAQRGKVPVSLEWLFSGYRLGVSDTPSSFLECVLSAVQPDFDSLSEVEQQTRLRRYRTLLKSKWILAQESLWTETRQTIQARLSQRDTYLNPRWAKRVLENLFQCRIILVSKTDWIMPLFHSAYLAPIATQGPIITIYENLGSESNVSNYPRCERVVSENNMDQAWQWYNTSLQPWNGQTKINPPQLPATIRKQYINRIGKVWAVETDRFVVLPMWCSPVENVEIGLFTSTEPSYLKTYQETDRQLHQDQIDLYGPGILSLIDETVQWMPSVIYLEQFPSDPKKPFLTLLENQIYLCQPATSLEYVHIVYTPQLRKKMVVKHAQPRDTRIYLAFTFPSGLALYQMILY